MIFDIQCRSKASRGNIVAGNIDKKICLLDCGVDFAGIVIDDARNVVSPGDYICV